MKADHVQVPQNKTKKGRVRRREGGPRPSATEQNGVTRLLTPHLSGGQHAERRARFPDRMGVGLTVPRHSTGCRLYQRPHGDGPASLRRPVATGIIVLLRTRHTTTTETTHDKQAPQVGSRRAVGGAARAAGSAAAVTTGVAPSAVATGSVASAAPGSAAARAGAAGAKAAAGSTVATGVALSAVATVRNLGVWDNEGGASMRARGIRDVWATTRVRTKGWGGGAPADSTLATIRSKSLAFGGVRCPADPDEQTADARCTHS